MKYIIERPARLTILGGAMLLLLACLCGPLQQAQQIQGTVGAAQSTLAPALTDIEKNRPTYEAQATQLAQTMAVAAPSLQSNMTQMFGTMNAVAPGFDLTMTAVIGQAGGGGGQGGGGESHQWATGASATSQLDDAHSAAQITGDPGTEACNGSLQPNAWASQGDTSVDTITLSYATPVVPTQIVIHEVLVPNAVTKVDVIDVNGVEHTVYTGQPNAIDFCPYLLQVQVTGVTDKIQTVVITVDQSVLGKRTQINAVELVGTP